MQKPLLSKSSFIKGLQCHKYLHLYKNNYNQRDRISAEKLSTFKRGTRTGILAQKLFPNGINLAPKSYYNYEKAINDTARHISLGSHVLYEPAFLYNGIIIFLDILVKKDNGWQAIEVKSSVSITNTYLNDAALQYYVLKGAGLNIIDISLIHINENYVFNGALDIYELFSVKSVLNEVLSMQENVALNIIKQKETLLKKETPDIAVGLHCITPYECEFMGFCWKSASEKPSVMQFEIWDIQKRIEMFVSANTDLEEMINNGILNNHEKIYANCILNKSEYIDKAVMLKFLSQINEPFCYVDVLGFKPVLPIKNGHKPYEHFLYLLTASFEEKDMLLHKSVLVETPDKHQNDIYKLLSELSSDFNTFVVYEKDYIHQLLDEMNTKVKFKKTKIISLKDILTNTLYATYKLKGTHKLDDVLMRLGLKNPFLDKNKINNVFESADTYLEFLQLKAEDKKNSIKNKITDYGANNTRYLKRLHEFFIKKSHKKI